MKHLGDYVLSKESFPKLEASWKEWKKPAFQKLTEQKKFWTGLPDAFKTH
jgi:hypothetical protein